MYSYNDHAIVLRRHPYGEADYILSLLTRNRGRVKVVAKGVRKLNSRRGGHLDLFNHVEVQVRDGYGLGIVTEVKALESFSKAKESLAKVGQFYYLSELIENLLAEEQENEFVYHELVGLCRMVENGHDAKDSKVEAWLRDFEISILKNLGYWSDDLHGAAYPQTLPSQREFNQVLIRDAADRQFNTPAIIRNFAT